MSNSILSIKKRKFFYFVLLLQTIIIGILLFQIFFKPNVLGTSLQIISADNPMINAEINFQSDPSRLKFFYEPKVITDQKETRSWLPYTVNYSINSDSLNERYDYNLKKPPGTFRIIALGDSYTFGHYVNTSDNYPEQLEDLLSQTAFCSNITNFEVINLGVPGYDLEYSVERFRKRGQKYDPDMVIWFAKPDDFIMLNELIAPKKEKYKKDFEAKNGRTIQHSSDENLQLWQKAIDDLLKELGEDYMIESSRPILNKINDYFHKKLLIMTFPSNALPVLEDFVNSRNDTYFLKLQTDYEKLPDQHHPTKNGYTKIVSQILDTLEKQQIIPCQKL